MTPDEMNQRALDLHNSRVRAEALRTAARELYDIGDADMVASAKWLDQRAEEIEQA